jgi:hypothetical protein
MIDGAGLKLTGQIAPAFSKGSERAWAHLDKWVDFNSPRRRTAFSARDTASVTPGEAPTTATFLEFFNSWFTFFRIFFSFWGEGTELLIPFILHKFV